MKDTTSALEPVPGGAIENSSDEADILSDQDQTFASSDLKADKMGGAGRLSQDLEDEPADFMRGEVDVVEQMNRTRNAMDTVLSGHHNLDEPDVSTGGLDAVFERPDGVMIAARDREAVPENGNEITLPVEQLDDIADENSLSLAELGETSLEAARASGYFGDEAAGPQMANDEALGKSAQSGGRGHRTGSFTDLGAGRSASTRIREHRTHR